MLKYKLFINQIVKKYGSGHRSLSGLINLLHYLYDGVAAGKPDTKIVPELLEDKYFEFLKPIIDPEKGVQTDFSGERKSAVFLRDALANALCCAICGARIHKQSITVDHTRRKADGGAANVDNGQLAHPYCNSTYKENSAKLAARN